MYFSKNEQKRKYCMSTKKGDGIMPELFPISRTL